MGRFFAVTIILIAVASAVPIVMHTWDPPADISMHGALIDEQMKETMIEAGVSFLAAQIILALFIWQFSNPGPNAKLKSLPGGAKGLVIAALLLVGAEVLALGIYPGPDGKFGPLHPDLINEGSQNFYGLDVDHDPDSKDDIVAASMAIPVNKEIHLLMHAKDVGHSFYVPELRVQQDFVPGLDVSLHFTATKTGKYEIVCTQLCGLGHYNMKAYLEVMSQSDFDDWLKKEAAMQ
jgi:cytochrome c oxidase subunit II